MMTSTSQYNTAPRAPVPAMTQPQYQQAEAQQQQQVNVPHPYRHNPYGAHQRVYYEQVQPVGVFQHNNNHNNAAPVAQNNYPVNQPQQQQQQQQYQYHQQQAPIQQQQQQMYSMIVPTEPGANYDPNAFSQQYPAPSSTTLAVNELEQFGNSVNSHYQQAQQAGPKMMPAELDTSDSYNQYNGSEENYSHNPNSMNNSGSSTPTAAQNQSMMMGNNNTYLEPLRYTQNPPMGTLHSMLTGRMKFCLYPNSAFEIAEPRMPKKSMVRMFIGQLPYHVTEMQLSWLVYMFGGCSNLFFFERITKTDHTKGGIKVPTGCFHCHMEPEQVQPLLHFLNDRLLVDDTGIWVADTDEEKNFLANYCYSLKIDRTKRFQGRPYGTVVAQVATSTFDPDTFVPRKGAARRGRQQ